MKKANKSEQSTIKMIADLKIALNDFELMVKNPKWLWNGRDISNFSLRPREAWANWILCAVLQKTHGKHITFAEDKIGDGIIVDRNSKETIPTEHVSALEIPKGEEQATGEQRIIDAINLKINKGSDYAEGKFLVVFFDGAGEFYRNKIRENIKGRHNFVAVYCIGLLTSGSEGYEYVVTEFREKYGDKSITYKVKININFTDWEVVQVKE